MMTSKADSIYFAFSYSRNDSCREVCGGAFFSLQSAVQTFNTSGLLDYYIQAISIERSTTIDRYGDTFK